MRCASCTHWDRYSDSDIANKVGDCRRHPPLLNAELLKRMLPGFGVSLHEYDDLASDLYIASAFPVTHETSVCGEFTSRMPL
jgi:hypothetical protein